MSIATVVTRGYGSFGTVPFVVTAGYSMPGEAVSGPLDVTAGDAVASNVSSSNARRGSVRSGNALIGGITSTEWPTQ